MSTIMLAEDDLTMVSLLKTLLDMEGYQVIALDVHDNIPEAVRRERPDVLLLDVHLSKVNGLDVVDELRRNDETKDIRIVMTSGLNLEAECLYHGADDFLQKPYMPDDLFGMLKRNIEP